MLVKKNPAYQLIRILFLLSILFPFLVLILLSFSERYTWPGILPRNYSLRAIRSILFQRKALSHVLYSLPYATSYLTEGMEGKIKRLEEQGRVFGASGLYLLYRVSIPLLMPYLIPAFMMSFILSMSQYILTVLLGGGKLKTLSLIMVPFIQSGERNLASVYGLLFLLSSFLLFLLMEMLMIALKRREKAC